MVVLFTKSRVRYLLAFSLLLDGLLSHFPPPVDGWVSFRCAITSGVSCGGKKTITEMEGMIEA
jgi:hypothetical protein